MAISFERRSYTTQHAWADEPKLTSRETEVLALIAVGLTNTEIAERLNTTAGTVNSHVHHILEKLGVANRTQAAAWAIAHGVESSASSD